MPVMRDVSGYQMSRDYGKLWDLAQNQSIVCVVDHEAHSLEFVCRWACQTIREHDEAVTATSRGTTYVWGRNEGEFSTACEAVNLEWIQPTACAEADPIARWIKPDSSKPPAPGLYLTEEDYPAGTDRSVMLITQNEYVTLVSEIDVEGSWSWVEFAKMDGVDRYWSVPIEWPS